MLTSEIFYREGAAACREYPTKDMLWHPFLLNVTNNTLYYILFMILHFIPGAFLDGLLKLSGRKTKLLRAYRIFWNLTRFLQYGLRTNHTFSTKEFVNLENFLLDVDKPDFSMDMSDYDPHVAMADNVKCIVEHMPGWKVSEEDLAKARVIAQKFKIAHYVVCSIVAVGMLYLSVRLLQMWMATS